MTNRYILALIFSVMSPMLFAMESDFTVEKTHNALRIMSFNIRRKGKEKKETRLWEQRKNPIIDLIATVQPDIMSLQEPTLEQINDLADELEKNYAWFGKGRGSSWFGMGTDEYNPIFYNKKRFKLITSGTFPINQCSKYDFMLNPTKFGLLPRICTWGIFQDKVTKKEFYVFNTHLDHKFEEAQIHGLKNILRFMKDRKIQQPVFLMGDFNNKLTPIMNNALRKFKNTKDLAKKIFGPKYTRTGWANNELKTIDHILVRHNKSITISQHVTIRELHDQELLSDHRPIFVDVEL